MQGDIAIEIPQSQDGMALERGSRELRSLRNGEGRRDAKRDTGNRPKRTVMGLAQLQHLQSEQVGVTNLTTWFSHTAAICPHHRACLLP